MNKSSKISKKIKRTFTHHLLVYTYMGTNNVHTHLFEDEGSRDRIGDIDQVCHDPNSIQTRSAYRLGYD